MRAWSTVLFASLLAVAGATLATGTIASSSSRVQFGGAATPVELTNWTLGPTNGDVAGFSPVPVTVPCTLIACLLKQGYFDFDPFYGKNLQQIDKAMFAVPWTYTTTFATTSAMLNSSSNNARVILNFEGINYRGDLTINRKVVAQQTDFFGALNRFYIDVTPYLDQTDGAVNTVNVTLWRMQDDPGQWRNNGTDLSLSFDDWNPHPPDLSTGIYRPVYLVLVPAVSLGNGVTAGVTFDGFVAHTNLAVTGETPNGDETVGAYLNISVSVTLWGLPANLSSQRIRVPVSLDLSNLTAQATQLVTEVEFDLGGASPAWSYQTGFTARAVWSWVDHAELFLPEPPLWWPWQFSRQRPFFSASVGTPAAGPLASFRFALRQVTKRLSADGALQFVVNRRAVTIMAGGFPPDMFLRVDRARLEKDFGLMIDMGLNAVRLEGHMMDDTFFNIADERGVLVMPGFGCCDGWQHWAGWPQMNYPIAAQSARMQARRLGVHPSVITFLLSSDQLPPPNVEAMYIAAFAEEAWPNTLVSSASQQFSYVSGISGVKMVGPYSWEPPNYWLDDGVGQLPNGTTMNYGGAWGFLTEGGPGEAPMTYASWRRTVPAEQLWNESTKSMDDWWSWHMGCPFGHFRNLTFYTPPLDARYGNSNSARTYLYRAQAANLEGIRAMFESYSRNRHVNATGVVQWQVKMAWPSHLWNLYDYYFVGGGGYYGAKRALEPLHAMMSYNDGSVWLIGNAYDGRRTVSPITVAASVLASNGSVLWSAADVVVGGLAADGTVELPSLTIPTSSVVAALLGGAASSPSTYFVQLNWHVEGAKEPNSTNWYWLSTQQDIITPAAWLASNGFRTPCAQWANFNELNQLPPSNLTTSVFDASPSTVNVTLSNSGSSIAFLIHVRFVNASSTEEPHDAPDIGAVTCSDNFFALLPGELTTLSCDLSLAGVASSEVRVVVETYNDVVSSPTPS